MKGASCQAPQYTSISKLLHQGSPHKPHRAIRYACPAYRECRRPGGGEGGILAYPHNYSLNQYFKCRPAKHFVAISVANHALQYDRTIRLSGTSDFVVFRYQDERPQLGGKRKFGRLRQNFRFWADSGTAGSGVRSSEADRCNRPLKAPSHQGGFHKAKSREGWRHRGRRSQRLARLGKVS